MLNKLLKHEFKDTARVMPFLYVVVLVSTALSYISFITDIGWLTLSSSVLLLFLSIAGIVITFVVVILRFYNNLYSREGYLMFSLPVKPHKLLISKTIVSISWILVSCVVFIGSFLCALYFMDAFETVSLRDLLHQITLSPFKNLIYAFIPLMILNIIYIIGQIFFSITLSNVAYFHKMGAASPIVIFLVLNVALKILESIFAIITPFSILIEGNSTSLSTQNMIGFLIENIKSSNVSELVIGLGGFIFNVIATCLLFYFNGKLMNKKVSLK